MGRERGSTSQTPTSWSETGPVSASGSPCICAVMALISSSLAPRRWKNR